MKEVKVNFFDVRQVFIFDREINQVKLGHKREILEDIRENGNCQDQGLIEDRNFLGETFWLGYKTDIQGAYKDKAVAIKMFIEIEENVCLVGFVKEAERAFFDVTCFLNIYESNSN